MDSVTSKSHIADTFSRVRDFSFQEKKDPINEKKINAFLDAILDLKKKLEDKTNKIYRIIERIEQITWFNDLNDDSLKLLNDLISSAKDLKSTLIRQYVSLAILRRKGIAKEEIKEFKNAIDELEESYEDLESVFFFLPEMPEFVETTKKLSLI